MDFDKRYRLSPEAVVRPERFGGLVYRYDNRKLYFLKSRRVVDFLDQHDTSLPLNVALTRFAEAQSLSTPERRRLRAALTQLRQLEVLREL